MKLGINTLPGHFVASFLSLLLMSGLSQTAAGYDINGHIQNGTTGQSVVNYPVAVYLYQDGKQALFATDTTNDRGSFQFAGLDSNVNYGLSVIYRLVKYEDLKWANPLPADQSLSLTVYDTTHTDTNIHILMEHSLITEGEGKLFVRQIMRIDNSANKTFIGTVPVAENTYKSLVFMLPVDATNVQAGDGLMSCCVGLKGQEFYDTMEVPPGAKDVTIYYEIPVNGGTYLYQTQAPYPIDSYIALVKRQKAHVQSPMLNLLKTATDDSYMQFAANKIKRGQIIPIRFDNFLQPPANYGPYFIGLFVLVVLGGIFFARRSKRQTRDREQPRSKPQATAPVDPVCHLPVNSNQVNYQTIYHGEIYYFCSEACQRAFESEPAKYISALPAPAH